MKLDAVLAMVKPFLAVDAKPDEIKAAIIAADKGGAKDAKDKAAKDRKEAYDKARDSMSDKDKEAFDAMPDGEEKDKVAKDACAEDPEHTNDEEVEAQDRGGKDNELANADPSTPAKGGKSEKGALDSAAVNKLIQAAVAARDELHAATREVEPIVGARTFDSAGDAYKAGLEALGVDLDGVPVSAYRAMLRLAKDRGTPAPIAMDSASVDAVVKLIPNYNRLP